MCFLTALCACNYVPRLAIVHHSIPVGVEREDIKDDLDQGDCQPGGHQQGSPLVAESLGAVQQPSDHAQVMQGIGRAGVVKHLKQPQGFLLLGVVHPRNSVRR